MEKRLAPRLLLALVITIGVTAVGWFMTRQEPVSVILYRVEPGRVERTASNTRVGTVKACRRAMLAPAIGGRVADLPVREGDRVAAGETLLGVWNDDLKARLQLAEAEKITAAALSREACQTATGAQRELKRLQRLLKDNLIAQEQVDIADTNAQARQSACEAARARYKVSDAQIAVTRTALEQTVIKAPFAGIIAEVNAELGEYVTPSPPGIPTLPAIDLVNLDCLYVSAPIDEVDAAPITTGMSACVQLDAFPDRRCHGVVRRIAPYVLDIEKQSRTVEVEVELTDPADLAGLMPGYSADIEISLEVKEGVLRIPTEAVLEGNRVYLFNETTSILEEVGFEPGIANWSFTEVRSGLRAGDRIVLSLGREGVTAGVEAIVEPGDDQQPQP